MQFIIVVLQLGLGGISKYSWMCLGDLDERWDYTECTKQQNIVQTSRYQTLQVSFKDCGHRHTWLHLSHFGASCRARMVGS